MNQGIGSERTLTQRERLEQWRARKMKKNVSSSVSVEQKCSTKVSMKSAPKAPEKPFSAIQVPKTAEPAKPIRNRSIVMQENTSQSAPMKHEKNTREIPSIQSFSASNDGSVKVAVRVRPLIKTERQDGCEPIVSVDVRSQRILAGMQSRNSDRTFQFDHVFGARSSQNEIYETCVRPLEDRFFRGFNTTLFAYGQTGSGKTYTMGTGYDEAPSTRDAQVGIVRRVVCSIFDKIKKEREQGAAQHLVQVSFVEIHNEELRDLLGKSCSDVSEEQCVKKQKKISIREDTSGNVFVAGLQEKTVSEPEELMDILQQGSLLRATGSTRMNAGSSRSHAIITITLQRQPLENDENIESVGESIFTTSKFHLIDLAGSERAKKTKASGERLREGININRGLLALGNVISVLSTIEDEGSSGNKKRHIPYRNSKLTRMLQSSLGGNSCTVMIACVSPADTNYEETINTLRYATRARNIKNKPIVNCDPTAAEISRLRHLVHKLQSQLLQNESSSSSGEDGNGHLCGRKMMNYEASQQIATLQKENNRLRASLRIFEEKSAKYVQLLGEREQECARLCTLIQSNTAAEAHDHAGPPQERRNEKMPTMNDTMRSASDRQKIITMQAGTIAELRRKIDVLESENAAVTSMFKMPSVEELTIQLTNFDVVDMSDIDSNDTSWEKEEQESQLEECEHKVRQEFLSQRMENISNAVEAKEILLKQVAESDAQLEAARLKLANLEIAIAELNKERSNLMAELKKSRSKDSSGTSYRAGSQTKKLRDLEAKLLGLRQKMLQQQRILAVQRRSEKELERMQAEVNSMKEERVRLQRQKAKEAEAFRKKMMERKREIAQLQRQGRRSQLEMRKLQTMHLKQQAMLKRKTAEAVQATKRLRQNLAIQQKLKSNQKDAPTKVESSNKLNSVKVSLDRLLHTSMEIENKRGRVEAAQRKRRELKDQLNQLKASDSVCTAVEKDECESALRVQSARIALLNNQIADMKGQQERITLEAFATRKTDAKCALQYLFDSLVHQAVKSKQARRLQERSSRKLLHMRSSLLQCQAAQDAIRHDFEKKLTAMEVACESKISEIIQDFERKPPSSNQYDFLMTPGGIGSIGKGSRDSPFYRAWSGEKRRNPSGGRRTKKKVVVEENSSDSEPPWDEGLSSEEEDNKELDPDWEPTPVKRRRTRKKKKTRAGKSKKSMEITKSEKKKENKTHQDPELNNSSGKITEKELGDKSSNEIHKHAKKDVDRLMSFKENNTADGAKQVLEDEVAYDLDVHCPGHLDSAKEPPIPCPAASSKEMSSLRKLHSQIEQELIHGGVKEKQKLKTRRALTSLTTNRASVNSSRGHKSKLKKIAVTASGITKKENYADIHKARQLMAQQKQQMNLASITANKEN